MSLEQDQYRRLEIWQARLKQTARDMRASAAPEGKYPPYGIDPVEWKALASACMAMSDALMQAAHKLKEEGNETRHP